MQRPHMLHIGNYCKITKGVTILTHDYSRSVVVQYLHENIGEAGMTWIGDNVFIGMHAVILMGAHVGNNSIVGAGAIVNGWFPDGVVIAGNPARIICSIEDFAEKRKGRSIEAAVTYARNFKDRFGKYPNEEQMGNAFSWLYLPRNQESIEKYPQFFKLSGVNEEQYKEDFLNSQPEFDSFELFLKYVDSAKDVT